MLAIYTLAQTFTLCASLYATKAPDLGRQWAGVCLEIAERAELTTVRPSLAVAVAWHESRLRRDVVGALGEVGPMQVRPEMHCNGYCSDTIGAGLVVLARYVDRHGEARGMCRYRGAELGCESPRVALADRIEGVGR
jgi:hypothetical protein